MVGVERAFGMAGKKSSRIATREEDAVGRLCQVANTEPPPGTARAPVVRHLLSFRS